jgi:4a-hydroxytetrahydrobiopterin dehydratase
MSVPEALPDGEIEARLAALPGWSRDGDAITRTFAHTYHELDGPGCTR